MQVVHLREIAIKDAKKYERLLSYKRPNYEKWGIEKYSLYRCWTVGFGDGWQMDLKICSSAPNVALFSEAVLLHYGQQVAYTEPQDSILGEWELEGNGQTFKLTVKEAK